MTCKRARHLLRLLTAGYGTFETSTDVRYTAAFGGSGHRGRAEF
jgi:hypothetical protein